MLPILPAHDTRNDGPAVSRRPVWIELLIRRRLTSARAPAGAGVGSVGSRRLGREAGDHTAAHRHDVSARRYGPRPGYFAGFGRREQPSAGAGLTSCACLACPTPIESCLVGRLIPTNRLSASDQWQIA